MAKIVIDDEFKSLIPPLTDDEYQQLEKSILAEGVREPIITWNGTIIDGHNRFSICEKHGIECPNKEREFESRDAAKIWIIENQFGRRNLSKYDSGVLALQLESLYAEEAKRRQATSTGGAHPQLSQKSDEAAKPMRTDEQLAKLAGVSRDTIRKVKVIENEANSGNETAIAARESVKSGEKSIHKAFTEIRHNGDKADKRNICTICGKPIEEGDYYPRDVFKHKACANQLERENKAKAKVKYADDGRRICSICGEPINEGGHYTDKLNWHYKCGLEHESENQRKYRDAERSLRENIATYTVELLLASLEMSAKDLISSWAHTIKINEDMGAKLTAREKLRIEETANNLLATIQAIKEERANE